MVLLVSKKIKPIEFDGFKICYHRYRKNGGALQEEPAIARHI